MSKNEIIRYVGTIFKGVIVAKGVNHTDYVDDRELELTEEQYNSIPIPCKLVDGEFIACEYPQSPETEIKPPELTEQDELDAMLIEHEYRLVLLENNLI